jgi:hypothetical protein
LSYLNYRCNEDASIDLENCIEEDLYIKDKISCSDKGDYFEIILSENKKFIVKGFKEPTEESEEEDEDTESEEEQENEEAPLAPAPIKEKKVEVEETVKSSTPQDSSSEKVIEETTKSNKTAYWTVVGIISLRLLE